MVNIYTEFPDLYPNKEPGLGKAELPRAPQSGSQVVPKERSPHPCGKNPRSSSRRSSASDAATAGGVLPGNPQPPTHQTLRILFGMWGGPGTGCPCVAGSVQGHAGATWDRGSCPCPWDKIVFKVPSNPTQSGIPWCDIFSSAAEAKPHSNFWEVQAAMDEKNLLLTKNSIQTLPGYGIDGHVHFKAVNP